MHAFMFIYSLILIILHEASSTSEAMMLGVMEGVGSTLQQYGLQSRGDGKMQ